MELLERRCTEHFGEWHGLYMIDESKGLSAGRCSEQSLVEAATHGDRSAFDELVRSLMHRVYSLCYRMTGDHQEADDCAQDAFLKAYRSLKSFRGQSSFSTWLYAIAINTCRNRRQSSAFRRSRQDLPIATAGCMTGGACELDPPDPAPTVLERLERHELDALLQRAIQALSPDARTVVVLRDVEGFSYEEIAQMTGWAIGTVKSRLARARSQLRESLKGMI